MASIKKRKNGYQYRISYKKNGIFKTKSKNGFRTKKEAEIAASEMELKLNKGYDVQASERLFTDYFRDWYEIFRKGKKSRQNDKDIRQAVEFAERNFIGVKMKELTREMYQRVLNEFGKNHATATVKKRHTYMRACIRDAIEDGVIDRDPTYKVVVKGKIPPKNEALKFLHFSEAKQLIKEVQKALQPRYISRFIILFGLATGCRFSEILGMTWDCINFKNQTVTINKTWDYTHTHDFDNTKNYESKRTITIDEVTLGFLRKLKAWQDQNAMATGLRNEKNLVFVDAKMELVTNNAVNKVLKKLCSRLEITSITCHSLRHTHASLVLYGSEDDDEKGVNVKYLQKRLGHKDIVTTLQTYSHIINELEQRESRRVDRTMNELYGSGEPTLV